MLVSWRVEARVDLAGGSWLVKQRNLFTTARPALFIWIVFIAASGTFGYKLRTQGIFSCQANGYTSDSFLAYCNTTGYGDYDHGAFWFGLERSAGHSAGAAEVMFLGNSRMQVGFSTSITHDWFSSAQARYFLLGFVHEKYKFPQELLSRIQPQAKVYVINLDSFFDRSESVPAKVVMRNVDALNRHQRKRLWQFVHRPVCQALPAVCGDQYVVFRSRTTGVWRVSGGEYKRASVFYDQTSDQIAVEQHAVSGREFLSRLGVPGECVIPTLVPTVETQTETASAIAAALGLELIAPQLEGLQTFDGSHLDSPSAERWSKAFFEAAGPKIRQCIDNTKEASG
jgi:hypothetical protein